MNKTNKAQHTPGPWCIRPGIPPVFVYAGAPGTFLCIADTDQTAAIEADEAEANARLIAAAPELLAALRGCLDALVAAGADGGPGDMPNPDCEAARAAIAKAEPARPSAPVCGHKGCTLRSGHIPGHTDR